MERTKRREKRANWGEGLRRSCCWMGRGGAVSVRVRVDGKEFQFDKWKSGGRRSAEFDPFPATNTDAFLWATNPIGFWLCLPGFSFTATVRGFQRGRENNCLCPHIRLWLTRAFSIVPSFATTFFCLFPFLNNFTIFSFMCVCYLICYFVLLYFYFLPNNKILWRK